MTHTRNDDAGPAELKAQDLIRKTAAGHRETYELTKENFEALLQVAVAAESELSTLKQEVEKLRDALTNEERRSEELLKRLDKARAGTEPDFCYDPDEWEFTSGWDERDQVHAYGDALPLGASMQVATLIRGPRWWVAHVPVTWDEDGDPEDTRIEWFDSEEAARAALGESR